MAAMRSARQLMGYIIPLALAVATAIAVGGSLRLYGIATSQLDPNLSVATTRLVNYARLLGGLAFLTCLPALARITPIRQGLGGLDLVGHELTELSGRELVVMRFAEALQLVAVIGFGITLFVLPYFHTDGSRALASLIAALVAVVGLGVWEGVAPKLYSREESAPPTSVWFGMQTFLGVGAILLLVLAQRF
jgi:formate hydrogenlyase subunit 4